MNAYRQHLAQVFAPYLEGRDGRVVVLAGAMARAAYDREFARRHGYAQTANRIDRRYAGLVRRLGADPLARQEAGRG